MRVATLMMIVGLNSIESCHNTPTEKDERTITQKIRGRVEKMYQ